MNNDHKITIALPAEVIAELERYAEAEDRPLAGAVRHILKIGLAHIRQEGANSFKVFGGAQGQGGLQ